MAQKLPKLPVLTGKLMLDVIHPTLGVAIGASIVYNIIKKDEGGKQNVLRSRSVGTVHQRVRDKGRSRTLLREVE